MVKKSYHEEQNRSNHGKVSEKLRQKHVRPCILFGVTYRKNKQFEMYLPFRGTLLQSFVKRMLGRGTEYSADKLYILSTSRR